MKRLRELRRAGNYTQYALATKLKVSQQTIAKWEAGKAEPNLAALRDIAVLFGTSVDDLLELQADPKVPHAVSSRLEQGKPKAVQSDTLVRLLAALEVSPQIGQSSRDFPRKLARLEQELRRREQRERHLRLAIELGDDESSAIARMAKARQRVELWRSNQSCSAFYVDRWSQLLALPPRKLAKEMSSLGDWEDAMFQNSPWSSAWT